MNPKQNKSFTPVSKALNVEKRRASFVVLEPQPEDYTTTDLHEDWYDEDAVTEGCYSFNRNLKKYNKSNIFHMVSTTGYSFIESYILPGDVTIGETFVKKGSWIATIEVEDSEQHNWIWEGIKDGSFNGLSIQCMAEEEPIE